MSRSALEIYVDILKVLAKGNTLKVIQVMYQANVNFSALKAHLCFLETHGLVEERILGKREVVYLITKRGIMVLKYFHEIDWEPQMIEEAKNAQSNHSVF